MNKIRRLGFTYKGQQKRTTLWRQSGTTNFISMPMADWLDESYVRCTLAQAGCAREEIDAFIAAAKN